MGQTQLLLFLHQYSSGIFFEVVPPSGTIENLISLEFSLFHPESKFKDIQINLVQQVAAVKIHSG